MMAPDRHAPAPKRSHPPFVPPRQRTAVTKTTSSSKPKVKPKKSIRSTGPSPSARKTPRRQSLVTRPQSSHSASTPSSVNSSLASSPAARSPSPQPDYILAEITTSRAVGGPDEISSTDPMIPPKLLTRLLHRHFQDDKTKIAKDANRVVAKYVDIFVREALARAAYEKAEGEKSGDIGDRRQDGYLEVCYSCSQ